MRTDKEPYYKEQYDLQNCDQEPIHRIRRSQEYGSFLCCNSEGSIWHHASEDIITELSTKSISSYLLEKTGIDFHSISQSEDVQYYTKPSFKFSLVVHSSSFGYKLEIEPTVNDAAINIQIAPYQEVLIRLSKAKSQTELFDETILQVHRLTGYDHIMIYKFDYEYNGEVIAEKKSDSSPSYLGLKFPSTDIPEQARALYFSEKVRIINDAAKDGHLIKSNPDATIIAFDMTGISMRGVSPIHREYLSNMGIRASFSVAIIEDDRLWGLIACHNKTPNFVNYNTRAWLRFLSEFISVNKNKIGDHSKALKKASDVILRSQIMENILSSKDLIDSLLVGENSFRTLIDSHGLIIKSGNDIKGAGDIPNEEVLQRLAAWLDTLDKFDVRSYNKAKDVLPIELHASHLTGMLIMQLSDLTGDYIIWTRKEKITDIVWAGDPSKTKNFDTLKGRISPRKSFEKWKETVHDRAEPWNQTEVYLAESLKSELRDNLYNKFNEVMLLNRELEEAYEQLETFSYSVSHDLKAPLRSIEGFSKILKEDYSEQLDEHGIHLLDIITDSITRMKSFIQDILNYSKLSKSSIDVTNVDLNTVIENQWKLITNSTSNEPKLHFTGLIPDIYGELNMINQVILNLLSNSVKYVAKGNVAEIKITHTLKEGFVQINIEDNGIGIPVDQREKVFEAFRRLVKIEDYEGTGVGLSIVKRVINRHSGTIEIKDSTISPTGVRFEFSLPSTPDFIELMRERNKQSA